MTTPLEFSWELIALAVGSGGNRGARRFRLRVRTERGEHAADLSAGDLPARIAELSTRLGLEGMIMTEDFDLTKLATIKREQLDDLDRELAELEAKRKRLAREVRAIEKCAAMLDGAERPRRAAKPKATKGASPGGPTTPELILAALPATIDELAEQLDKPRGVIARLVGQLTKAGRVVREGDDVRAGAKARRAA